MPIAKVIVLGSGTSTGVPIIGCDCVVCQSTDPKNKRTRASLYLETDAGHKIVIDTGPDFRQQMIRENIGALDAIFYTHTHADHVHGFDDLRALYFRSKTPLDCFLAEDYAAEIRSRFAYAFEHTGYQGTPPQVNLCPRPDDCTEFRFGMEIESFRVMHGHLRTSVYRFDNFAYATDFKLFTEEQIARWRGKIKVMVASGIHWGKHPAHSVIDETCELFYKLGVERGYITHIAHQVDHNRDSGKLPSFAQFAYDGLRLFP